MSKERYELVPVADVAVGEHVKTYDGSDFVWTEREVGKAVVWKDDYVFRLVPYDEADVLRRALRLATEDTFGTPANHIVDRYIDQARRELESEAREGQKGGE